MIFRDVASGGNLDYMRSWGWDLYVEISALLRRDTWPCFLSAVWGHSRKVAICKPEPTLLAPWYWHLEKIDLCCLNTQSGILWCQPEQMKTPHLILTVSPTCRVGLFIPMLHMKKTRLRDVLRNLLKATVNKGQSKIEIKVSLDLIYPLPIFILFLFFSFFLKNIFWLLKCSRVNFLKRNVIGHKGDCLQTKQSCVTWSDCSIQFFIPWFMAPHWYLSHIWSF